MVRPVHGYGISRCASLGRLQSSTKSNLRPEEVIPIVLLCGVNLVPELGPCDTRNGVNSPFLVDWCRRSHCPPSPREIHLSPPFPPLYVSHVANALRSLLCRLSALAALAAFTCNVCNCAAFSALPPWKWNWRVSEWVLIMTGEWFFVIQSTELTGPCLLARFTV